MFVGVGWELKLYFPWCAHHCLHLLCVGGEANTFEHLNEDVEGLLKELHVSRCDLSVIHIKYGKEGLDLVGKVSSRVIERLTH